MIWNWPQITWGILTGIVLLAYVVMDGKPRTGQWSLAMGLLGTAVSATLLYFGGFWEGATP